MASPGKMSDNRRTHFEYRDDTVERIAQSSYVWVERRGIIAERCLLDLWIDHAYVGSLEQEDGSRTALCEVYVPPEDDPTGNSIRLTANQIPTDLAIKVLMGARGAEPVS